MHDAVALNFCWFDVYARVMLDLPLFVRARRFRGIGNLTFLGLTSNTSIPESYWSVSDFSRADSVSFNARAGNFSFLRLPYPCIFGRWIHMYPLLSSAKGFTLVDRCFYDDPRRESMGFVMNVEALFVFAVSRAVRPAPPASRLRNRRTIRNH